MVFILLTYLENINNNYGINNIMVASVKDRNGGE